MRTKLYAKVYIIKKNKKKVYTHSNFNFLYSNRPTVSTTLSRLANYDKNEEISPEEAFTDADGKTCSVKAQLSKTGSKTQSKGANLGTVTGVFLPCIQNIFGVILFIRMVWIVGTAGIPFG